MTPFPVKMIKAPHAYTKPNRTPHSTPCRDSCKTPFLNLIRGGQSFQSPLMKEYALNPTRDPTIARVLSSTLLPFLFWGLLINQNSKNKGTLIIKGLLRNLDNKRCIPNKRDFRRSGYLQPCCAAFWGPVNLRYVSSELRHLGFRV